MQIEIIGYVRNRWDHADPSSSDQMKEECSEIVLNKEFEDGLFKIDIFEYINVIFFFHKSSGYELQTITRSGDFRGVFASCSPRRPSLIGLTTARLLERTGNILRVTGLDAINGTPILDIKPLINHTIK